MTGSLRDAWRVAASVDALLEGATDRVSLTPPDGKSGSRIEKVRIDGVGYVLKSSRNAWDWLMQASGDGGGRHLRLWQSALMGRVSGHIDHTIVGIAALPPDGVALLMRDVTEQLVPAGDTELTGGEQDAFLAAMAALHAELWDWQEPPHLTDLTRRYSMFAPSTMAAAVADGAGDGVPRMACEGWARLEQRDRDHAVRLVALAEDPAPLVEALATTPQCFVHGDWKAGNLGRGPDGRVILLDWALPGRAACCSDLAWYLSVNAARLPASKEETIEAYRSALERRGIDTGPWWDTQIALALLGAAVQFGWEKALGREAELAWWLAAADAGWATLHEVTGGRGP